MGQHLKRFDGAKIVSLMTGLVSLALNTKALSISVASATSQWDATWSSAEFIVDWLEFVVFTELVGLFFVCIATRRWAHAVGALKSLRGFSAMKLMTLVGSASLSEVSARL